MSLLYVFALAWQGYWLVGPGRANIQRECARLECSFYILAPTAYPAALFGFLVSNCLYCADNSCLGAYIFWRRQELPTDGSWNCDHFPDDHICRRATIPDANLLSNSCKTSSLVPVLVGLSISIGLSLLCFQFNTRTMLSSNIIVAGLLILFVLQKNGTISEWTSAGLRILTGQAPELASPSDLSWLGFSFIAFRLIHAALDRKAKRLPAYSLDEFAAYVLFFPAILAGPINRHQRIQELHQAAKR